MAGAKGDQPLGCDLYAVLDKIDADVSKIQRNETKNGLPNIKDLSTETFQLQMPVLHQSKSIPKSVPQV